MLFLKKRKVEYKRRKRRNIKTHNRNGCLYLSSQLMIKHSLPFIA